jgi:DNA-binding NtrC family response regulator
MGDILVIDDEADICRAMRLIFTEMGHRVHVAHNIRKAREIVGAVSPDIAFIDIRLGQENGMDLLKSAKVDAPEMTVIMISAFGSVESAVQAMKIGAYDYICKPFINDEIEMMVKRIFEHRDLVKNNENLQSELDNIFRFENLVGESPVMRGTKHLITKVLHSRANVLLTGETGTGKSLAAHMIHHHGPRKDYPFVTINCGAIPENLLESELFGHRKGSFTGAFENKTGLFVKADKGTVFLDELSELPFNMQVKLLNVIQTKEVLPVGSTDPVKVDVRIIAASNQDMYEAVKKGVFREDLFYRLKVVEIRMPLLREYKDDIPQLVSLNVKRFAKENGKEPPKISQDVFNFMQEYHWPGNVRELENILERAILMCEGDTVELEDIQVDGKHAASPVLPPNDVPKDLKSRVAVLENEYIQEVLKRHNYNKGEAARYLNINVTTLYRKLER